MRGSSQHLRPTTQQRIGSNCSCCNRPFCRPLLIASRRTAVRSGSRCITVLSLLTFKRYSLLQIAFRVYFITGESTQGGNGARCTMTKIGGRKNVVMIMMLLLVSIIIYYYMNTFITLHQCTFNSLFALFSTLYLKKHPRCFSYNSRKHCRIFIIFGRNITEKACNQKMLYFPNLPN